MSERILWLREVRWGRSRSWCGRSDGEAAVEVPKGRTAAATFIFLTVTLDMLALGMIAPVLPRLIAGFMHGDTSSAAKMLGLFGTVFAGIQFVFSPVLGSISDRYGRRPVVAAFKLRAGAGLRGDGAGSGAGMAVVGRVVSGLTASSVPTAMAYMADVTPVEKRASAFGMLGRRSGWGSCWGRRWGVCWAA